MYDRSWFQHPSQREYTSPHQPTNAPKVVPTTAPSHTLPLPPTSTNAPIVTSVDAPSIPPTTELLLQREDSDTSTVVTSNGWNRSQPHNTRFKKRFHANITPTAPHID